MATHAGLAYPSLAYSPSQHCWQLPLDNDIGLRGKEGPGLTACFVLQAVPTNPCRGVEDSAKPQCGDAVYDAAWGAVCTLCPSMHLDSASVKSCKRNLPALTVLSLATCLACSCTLAAHDSIGIQTASAWGMHVIRGTCRSMLQRSILVQIATANKATKGMAINPSNRRTFHQVCTSIQHWVAVVHNRKAPAHIA